MFLPGDLLFNNSFHDCPDSCQLLEELCLIHEHGVVRGDLQAPNAVLQNGSNAHFIDFLHGYEHRCTGRTTCFELKGARRFSLLTTAHLV
jgi:hypothetical protein